MVSCSVSLLGNGSFVKTPWVLFQILNFDSHMFVGFAISAIEPQQTDQPGRWNAWNEMNENTLVFSRMKTNKLI